MKRIIIFSHGMEIGGAERALLGILECIDTEKYDISLFLMKHKGELMRYIPDTVRLLPEIPQYASLAVPITDIIKRRQFGIVLGRIHGKIAAKIRIKQLKALRENEVALEYSHKYTRSKMPQISNVEYDLAISFLTPHYFVNEKVKAKKKAAWIHTDYTVVQVDVESQLKMWDKYDVIIAVSENVRRCFLKNFPSLINKVQVIENIMPMKYMIESTRAFTVEQEMINDGSIKLLSIGRFCAAKNFDKVPSICRKLRCIGLNVKWYLIGYGGDEKVIRQKIVENTMSDYVIILGKKENPYPYIKCCDLYVQPSRYEGKCVSVIEAQILKKPVIITDYPTAESQLVDGYDGVIVPMDSEACVQGIARVIKNKELQEILIRNTQEKDYSNVGKIKNIYQLLDC